MSAPSPRWRRAAWALGAAMVLVALVAVLRRGPSTPTPPRAPAQEPVAVEAGAPPRPQPVPLSNAPGSSAPLDAGLDEEAMATARERWIQQWPQLTVEVEVRDGEDRPVEGAGVIGSGGQEGMGEVTRLAATDAHGRAVVTLPATYRGVSVLVRKGALTASTWVRQREPGTARVVVYLSAPVALTVHVADHHGAPVAGARVQVSEAPEGHTDSRGEVVLEGVALGEHVIDLAARGCVAQTQRRTLQPLTRQELFFTLAQAAELSLTCLCDDRPCQANVRLQGADGGPSFVGRCDAAGQLLLGELPGGSFELSAALAEGTAQEAKGEATATLRAGTMVSAQISLKRTDAFTATLDGVVRGRSGRPVPGAQVVPRCGGLRTFDARTDEQGRFRLEQLPRGRCEVSAFAVPGLRVPGKPAAEGWAEVPGRVELTFSFDP